MKNDLQYFGIAEESIQAAQRRHASRPNLIVPTVKEIATLPLEKLEIRLVAWMEDSAIEIVPSRTQIALVRAELLARCDAYELKSVISMCTNYIDGA